MILSEYNVDGLNNSTVKLKQKNHDALMNLKYKHHLLHHMESSDHCTLFDGGRIIDVGPGVMLCFNNDGLMSYAVLYGDVDKIKAWLKMTIKKLKEEQNGKES